MSGLSPKHTPFADEIEPCPADDVLPEYSPTAHSASSQSTAPRAEHRATLHHHGHTWLTLLLRSHIAHEGKQPYFFGGTPITGAVELDLVKADDIEKITIQILGKIIGSRLVMDNATWVDRSHTFFEATHLVWQAAPAITGAAGGVLSHLRGHKSEKLSAGTHTFAFSLDLPARVQWEEGKQYGLDEFDMPATFVEHGARGSVYYELELQVKYSSILSPTDFLKQPFSFCPATRPGPLADKRRAAYEAGEANIPGSLQDPEGWETGQPVTIKATIFGQREIGLEYRLSLAKPLCYTRGSIIPCELQIACEDAEGLDLLSAPSAPDIKLLCHIQFKTTDHAKQADLSSALTSTKDNSYYVESRVLQDAVWWTPRGDAKMAPRQRRLSGEIHVPPTLTPGIETPLFEVYYTVALFAPAAAGLVLKDESARQGKNARMLLHVMRVGVASLHPKGVRPLPITPPSYVQPEPWPTSSSYIY